MCNTNEELSELDILYLPSRWSKRLDPEIICENHVEVARKASERTKTIIPCELNIPYGSREKEKYDLFGTDLDSDAPVFIFIHGGYWQEESITRECYWFIAETLHKAKVKSLFVGYELCPSVQLPELVKEVEECLDKCFEYADKSGSRSIYLAGHSAGGHLIANIFNNYINTIPKATRDKIKAAFLLCGIYNLTPLLKTHINEPLKLDEQLAIELSPQRQPFTAYDIPIYVVAAENDSPVFVEETKNFYQKLNQAGVNCELEIIENVDHFDIMELLICDDFKLTKLIVDVINKSKQC